MIGVDLLLRSGHLIVTFWMKKGMMLIAAGTYLLEQLATVSSGQLQESSASAHVVVRAATEVALVLGFGGGWQVVSPVRIRVQHRWLWGGTIGLVIRWCPGGKAVISSGSLLSGYSEE